MDQQQQRAVARGLKRGDPEAWTSLYDAYYEQVCRCVVRLLGGESHDAADVVQETFLAAARSAGGYDAERGSLWAWLYGIARNQVALHWRDHHRRRQIGQARERLALGNGQLDRWLAGRDEAPPDVLESTELATIVRAVLIELPDDYEYVLTAKYVDEATAEEIAEPTNSSVAAVRSRLQRAREAFRNVFKRISADPTIFDTGDRHDS